MLPAKKPPVVITRFRSSQKNLQNLYARRSAIDALIHSLEEYNRFRVKRSAENKRKSA